MELLTAEMIGYTYLFVFLLVSLFGCDVFSSGDNTANDAREEEIVDQAPISRAFADELTERVNEARGQARRCGTSSYPEAPPLHWNDALAQAALQHARDMAANDYFSHTGTDGSSASDRIAGVGYDARTWGENIAAGQRTAEQVVASWLDSPGHCANIMKAEFTDFGTAFAENDATPYGIYWTMVLAAPR